MAPTTQEPTSKEHTIENQNLNLDDTMKIVKEKAEKGVETAKEKTTNAADQTKDKLADIKDQTTNATKEATDKAKAAGEVLADEANSFGDKVDQKQAEKNAPPSMVDQAKGKIGEVKDKIGNVFSGDDKSSDDKSGDDKK